MRATFSTPEDLKAKVTDALWDWEKRHGGGDPGSAPADPRKYLQKLAARTGHIDIRGFEVGSGKVHQFPIDELYIPLTTAAPSEPGRDRTKLQEGESRRVTLEEALERPRLLITGDPGSGKTTFLRKIAHGLVKTYAGGTDGFPVLIGIADLAKHIDACVQ